MLKLENNRNQLRSILIETYFVPKIQLRLAQVKLENDEAFSYSQSLTTKVATTFKIKEAVAPYKTDERKIRDQGFRRAIVKAYNHRCAICGIRIITAEGHTAVAGAHIVPWSFSHNDDPRNGVALCGLCHWAFDAGMTTILKDYTIKLSLQLSTEPNVAGHLTTLADRHIFTPTDNNLWPAQAALEWHQENIFKKI